MTLAKLMKRLIEEWPKDLYDRDVLFITQDRKGAILTWDQDESEPYCRKDGEWHSKTGLPCDELFINGMTEIAHGRSKTKLTKEQWLSS